MKEPLTQGTNSRKITVTLKTIRQVFEKRKQDKLNELAGFFEKEGNAELAKTLREKGIPKAIYAGTEVHCFARAAFAWMDVIAQKNPLLEPGIVIFTWDKEFEYIKLSVLNYEKSNSDY
jgi:hypothetical protein